MLSEPFSKLPPDGPLQKLNIPKYNFPLAKENFPMSVPKNFEEKLTIEDLKKEILKYQERERFLREELLVFSNQTSARVISEQDKLISQLASNPESDIEYLDNLKSQANFLAWSSEMFFSTSNTEESPSMDDISQ